MVGREHERAVIDRLLVAAESGGSSVLVVRGEAGIGKTALLDYAAQRAVETGARSIAVRGVQGETAIPYAVLSDLCRPVMSRLTEIPEPQATALRGALALGPPTGLDRFTVCAALLSLLAAAAERQPVLVTVDDVSWVDPPSAEAILFAARRLEAEGIVLLIAARNDEPSPTDDLGFEKIELSGLSVENAQALLANETERTIHKDVLRYLVAGTAGNPLALLESTALLSAAELEGQHALSDRPLPGGRLVDSLFSSRLAALPGGTRLALTVAAASGSGDLLAIEEAARELGIEPDALAEAERAGLVVIRSGRVEFRHPLIRSAAYHASAAPDLRAAHRALAGHETTAERRAWQLAAAATGPDEETAAALERAAISALKMTGFASAALAFARAAELTPEATEQARRFLEAGKAFEASGDLGRASVSLAEALDAGPEPVLRAEIQHIRGRLALWQGETPLARELLVDEGLAAFEIDERRAVTSLWDGIGLLVQTGDVAAAREVADHTVVLTGRSRPEVQSLARGCRASVGLLLGELDALDELVTALDRADFATAGHMATLVAHGYIWNERYDEARRFLEAQVTTLRQASAPMMLPYLLAAQGELDLRTGRWQDARAAFTEAVDLGETTGLRSPYAGAYLARLEAFRGREEAARRNAGPAVAFGEQLGLESLVSYGRHALGLVELGADRPEHAIHELEQLAALLDRHGIENPGVVQWAPDLIEAYARCGRGKEAEAHLARLERQGRRTGNTWAQAAAHRCRGLLASEPDYRAEFERALQLHELTATPFERARTELCYGERLRRGRHRREARGWLASAAETFDALGALPWASRARAELRSSGQTLRRREAWDQDQLTARELQIAVLVAGGASNRDAAAALFLSPRTIDAHLGSIYRKLDVHSRQELASALTG